MTILTQAKNLIKSSSLYRSTKASSFKILNLEKKEYLCPICNYRGPFIDTKSKSGIRMNAECPSCGSYERHRLQKLVIDKLQKSYDFSKMRMLHFAPESCFRSYFKTLFGEYLTADLYDQNVDFIADLTDLPFKDSEFDIIFASHILEHIENDLLAISEIKRVLKTKGIAVLPVPIVGNKTVEYSSPNLYEFGHIRAPGLDYFERYNKYFSHVKEFSSDDFPENYQTYIYEDRSIYPTKKLPLRIPTYGERHIDIVPVCIA